MKTYSAGIATAYGAAVRGGYTGTYADYCREQARFAEYAQEVAQDRDAVEALTAEFSSEMVPNAIVAIEAKGAEQVLAVQETGGMQITGVTAEGTAQKEAVEAKGAEQIADITAEGTAQKSTVASEGATQVAAVTAEGTAQKDAIAAEGTAQISAVDAKGEEVRESIPADYTAFYEAFNALGLSAADGGINITYEEVTE